MADYNRSQPFLFLYAKKKKQFSNQAILQLLLIIYHEFFTDIEAIFCSSENVN